MKALRVLVATLLALAAAEGLLRILEEPRNAYGGVYRPTIYFEDSQQGFSLGPPGYQGMMVVPGARQPVWFALDQDGLRRVPTSRPGAPQVLVIGGASQTFGHGLADAETWPARMAAHWPGPADVRIFALPGTSLEQDWQAVERARGAAGRPALIVVTLYVDARSLGVHSAARPMLFRGRVDEEPDIASFWRQQSYLIDALADGAPKIVRSFENTKLANWFTVAWRTLAGHPPAPAEIPSTAPVAQAAARLHDFVAMLGARTDPPGRVIVATLPDRGQPGDYYRPFLDALPEGVATIDLQPILGPKIMTRDLFGDDHYRAPLADAIGAAIGRAICQDHLFSACQ